FLPEAAPKLVEARVAAAASDVELVLQRVLLVVVLVVFLRRVELGGGLDRRDDRLPEGLLLLPFGLGSLREPLLLVGVVEDRRPVLRPAVAELAIGDRRVVVQPEGLKQLLVAHLGRVVG